MSKTESVCISCLETGNLFNIFDTHECEGIEENYAEMLKLSFDVSIPRKAVVNHMCEKCILTLRQIYYFKQTIIKNLKDLENNRTVHIKVEYLDESEPICETEDILEQELDPETGQMIFLVKNDKLNDIDNKKICLEYESYEICEENANENHEYILSNKFMKKKNLLESVKEKECLVKNIENVQEKENPLHDGKNGKEETLSDVSHYQCGHCNKAFQSKIAINRHMKTHLEGPFSCQICSQEFTKLNSLHSHVWRVHRARDGPYACAQCGRRFPTFHTRLRHLREEHSRVDQYPCPLCDKIYPYAGARSTHIRETHMQEHRHSCTHCKMGFFKRRALLSHLATIHGIGEKKHKCTICSKSFYRSTVLKYHMKTHEKGTSQYKKHQCHICPAQFTYEPLLRHHMKTHQLESQTQADCYNVET